MKLLLAASLFLLPLLDVRPATEGIAFDPEEGLSLTKTFQIESLVELEDLSFAVDGEDMTAMLGDFFVEVVAKVTYVVTDDYLATSEGRPTKLQRSFDELDSTNEFDMETMMGPQDMETSTSSELEGVTVLFTWNEEDGDYAVQFADEEEEHPDEKLLEGLDVDMDLLGLLPDDSVSEGDSWTVDTEELTSLFMPGGNLQLMPDEGMEEIDIEELTELFAELQEQVVESLDEWLDGEATCTFTGTRDEDGTEVAVVEIAIEYTIDAELSALVQDGLDGVLEMQELPIEVEIAVDLCQVGGTVTSEGELLWNLAGGHVHALKLSTEYDLSIELEVTGESGGEGGMVEASMEFSGSMESSVATG